MLGTSLVRCGRVRGQNPQVIYGAAFDGTNDYLIRGAALTGVAATKYLTIAARIQIAGSNNRYIFEGTDGATVVCKFQIVNTTNLLQISIDNVAGSNPAIFITSSTAYTSADGWLNILVSADVLNDTEGQLYVNDVDDYDAATSDLDNEDLGYDACTNWAIGGQVAGTAKFNGDMEFLYVNFSTAIDFSIEANRRLFFTSSGEVASLGANGETPTGTSPIIFLRGTYDVFQNNLGTGGGFTLNGTLGEIG